MTVAAAGPSALLVPVYCADSLLADRCRCSGDRPVTDEAAHGVRDRHLAGQHAARSRLVLDRDGRGPAARRTRPPHCGPSSTGAALAYMRTRVFPVLAPLNRPASAAGALSKPSTMYTAECTVPARSIGINAATAAAARS